MGHDAHFLERLDRVERVELLELALGLYRDHELVQQILGQARLPEAAERVAIALDDGGEGPHVVVARSGAFVTCLGKGMSTGALPVVSRAQLDALAAKIEHVREGLALAKKRGLDEARVIARIRLAGPAVPREDFVAASAMLGAASPLLLEVYASAATVVDELHTLRRAARGANAALKRSSDRRLACGAWAMAHSAMLVVHNVSREWVGTWGELEMHDRMSPWSLLVMQSSFPFVVRAAWLAARLGKPLFSSYRARFFAPPAGSLELRENGWGLVCMALRHESLRGDAIKALRSPPKAAGLAAWASAEYAFFANVADLVEEKEDTLRQEAMDLGRDAVVVRTRDLPESSPHRYRERAEVPDDLALPALFDLWYDASNGERAADALLVGVVAASRARAEDFYFPAQVLHAMGEPDLEGQGESLVEMRGRLVGTPKPVRVEARPGRNDPCHCGSGKKFKKCHGR